MVGFDSKPPLLFPDGSGSMADQPRNQRDRFVRKELAGATVIFDYRATKEKT
jgi:hypothetical protein